VSVASNIKSFSLKQLAVALVLSVPLMALVDRFRQEQREIIPASAWFEVNSIYVPSFLVGENPRITYDRAVKEPFRGFWVVEVQRKDPESNAFVLECHGSGVNDYEPADYIPQNSVTWEWFVGDKCADIPVGEYRLRVSWVMKRPNWPEKEVVAYSDGPFFVTARPD